VIIILQVYIFHTG